MEPAAPIGENSVAGFAGARRMRAPALEECIFVLEWSTAGGGYSLMFQT
jgi:hypothetical protein